jgi:DNA repair protein RadA/Sms
MAKKKTLFECQACGFQSAKWMGKCPNCDAWDQFLELSSAQQEVLKDISSSNKSSQVATSITNIKEEFHERFSSNDSELDLVLGGGIVPGSLTLIGGSPGVGKSTLLLKIGANLAKSGKKVLYISGEESLGQIKIRANRLDANDDNLYLLSEIRLAYLFDELKNRDYEILIVDSIQTLYSEKVSSAPGSVSQVREITFELMRYSKEHDISTFIIGHITKEGSIAGPRVLEHMVDTVLYFEGDANRELRMLRGIKNRYGSTSEVGIFEMTKAGLMSATDISKKFFTRGKNQTGSAITVVMEGSRPIVLEVQALVAESSGSNPKRSATGYEQNRLTMLLALLERKLDLPLNGYDVFINIAGGIKINETAADLAIIAAIISSFRDRVISNDSIFIGEVSLIGDIRDIYNLDLRLREAETQGFTKAIVAKKPLDSMKVIKCYEVTEVEKLIDWM